MAEIENEIDRIWRDTQPEVARICTHIAQYVVRQRADAHLHLTYSLLKTESSAIQDSDLMTAVQYLTGAGADLLEIQFEFADDNGDFFPLSKSDVAIANREGAFFHPETGDLVEDFASAVLVYFVPTDKARQLQRMRG